MKSKGWSRDDLETLRLYVEQGRSVYRIAAALGRTVSGVRSMANRIGLSIQASRSSAKLNPENASFGRERIGPTSH
jgi:hypothetical protein